jgi:hypothetical protein
MRRQAQSMEPTGCQEQPEHSALQGFEQKNLAMLRRDFSNFRRERRRPDGLDNKEARAGQFRECFRVGLYGQDIA